MFRVLKNTIKHQGVEAMDNYLHAGVSNTSKPPFLNGISPVVATTSAMWPDFFVGQPGRPVKVLLVDDDSHVRNVIANELLADPRILLVAQGSSLKEGKRLVVAHDFDVLLVDLNLGDGLGFDLIGLVKAAKPMAEVIAISVMEDEEHALRAFELGATGYYVKHTWFGNFPDAVLQVANGGASITPSLARRLLKKMDHSRVTHSNSVPNTGIELLSDREREILKLVATGYISSEISEMLKITIQTVNTHIKNTHHKLHVRTRAQAVSLAASSGLI
jgi:DNA-binding NarL/FixJ family response regulator